MKILIAEDDSILGKNLQASIKASGFLSDLASDGEEALYLGETGAYAAAILDLGLPLLDGVTVLKRWRDAGNAIPVLVLTARGRWPEKRQAFNAGADDYLTKPFEMEEVSVRLRALIRRAAGHSSPMLCLGPIEMDTRAQIVRLDGEPVSFTSLEYRILEFLMHRPGQVISRLALNDQLYGSDADPDSNVLDVIIGRIRKKTIPALIETIRGRGYKLKSDWSQQAGSTTARTNHDSG